MYVRALAQQLLCNESGDSESLEGHLHRISVGIPNKITALRKIYILNYVCCFYFKELSGVVLWLH